MDSKEIVREIYHQAEVQMKEFFERMDDWRAREGLKPSQIGRALGASFEIEDLWREWWEESGDEYS